MPTRLRERAIAYLNVDSAASGPRFAATAVPALNPLLAEVSAARSRPGAEDPGVRAKARAPARGGGIAADGFERRSRRQPSRQRLRLYGVSQSPRHSGGRPVVRRTLRRLSLDLRQPQLGATIGDPGFRYHVTLVQLWGALAMRLAEAEVIPLDYAPYAKTTLTFLDEIERRWTPRDRGPLNDARQVATELGAAAAAANDARRSALENGDAGRIAAINRAFIQTVAGVPSSRRNPGSSLGPTSDLRAQAHSTHQEVAARGGRGNRRARRGRTDNGAAPGAGRRDPARCRLTRAQFSRSSPVNRPRRRGAAPKLMRQKRHISAVEWRLPGRW